MASETYTQIRTWLDQIFKSNGRKFITGTHANEGFKKVLAKPEEIEASKGQANGIASLDENGKVPAGQLPDAENSGGSADLLRIHENPTYNPDGTLKIIKYSYVSDPTKYYEERFEYTDGLATKIEIKDDLAATWIQKTDIYNTQNQLQKPTIADIEAWTIV